MSGLLLIKDSSDWDKFKMELLVEHGIDKSALKWGSRSNPTSYPCLSSGVVVDSSIVCVFVYEEDAKRLLQAVGQEKGKKSKAEPQFEGVVPPMSQEGAWNRHMVALFLAMLHEMISVGLTKEDRFESLMEDMLRLVDQKHATDLDKIKELINREFRGNDK